CRAAGSCDARGIWPDRYLLLQRRHRVWRWARGVAPGLAAELGRACHVARLRRAGVAPRDAGARRRLHGGHDLGGRAAESRPGGALRGDESRRTLLLRVDGDRLPRPGHPGFGAVPAGGADRDADPGGRAQLFDRWRAGARAGRRRGGRGHSRRALSHPAASGGGRVLPAQSHRLRPLAPRHAPLTRSDPRRAVGAADPGGPYPRCGDYGIPLVGGVDADPLYWVIGPESEEVYTEPVVVSVPSAAMVATCTPR